MFFRHYKGGVYHTLGITEYLKDTEEDASKFFNATHTEEGYEVNVFMVGSHFYVLGKADAGMVLYMGQDGRLWLRPFSMFHGDLEIDGQTVKRFELICN